MISKFIIYSLVLLSSFSSTLSSSFSSNIRNEKQRSRNDPPIRDAESVKFIGPHNIHDHYFDLRWTLRTTHKPLLDGIKSTYHFRPILRDLDLSRLDDKEIFSAVMKREIAWSYPDLNEFGLMRCEELYFNNAPLATYIELTTDGRRISIQKFENSAAYQKAAKDAKELQTKCLIKGLEKIQNPSKPVNCKTQIPYCFSDSWRQIWWKVID